MLPNVIMSNHLVRTLEILQPSQVRTEHARISCSKRSKTGHICKQFKTRHIDEKTHFLDGLQVPSLFRMFIMIGLVTRPTCQ